MRRTATLLITAVISASLAVFANGSSVLAIRKVALGVSMNDNRNINTLTAFTQSVNYKPAIWTVWSDWGDPSTRDFPTGIATELKNRSVTPMIMWEPINPANQSDCSNWSNAKVLAGLDPQPPENPADPWYYPYVLAWAQAAKDHGGTILLRFMHEMNGYWYVWGTDRCTNTPASIKQVWKKVYNIFKGPEGVGATNVKFLWTVSGAGYVSKTFPGDAFVDYIGLTAFNWGTSSNTASTFAWRSMDKAMSETINPLLKLNTSKPIIAAEVGSNVKEGCPTCKPDWIKNGYPKAYSKWPRLKALVYMNIDLTSQGHPDWRLTTPPAALTAYKNIVAQSKFRGSIPP